jgi:hypothetical protein
VPRQCAGNPTYLDGLAYAAFLNELSTAFHALPARPIVTMDSESLSNACWSAPPPPGEASHVWDEKPCPWIRRFWHLGALAESALDMIIPMDTYGTNTSEFEFALYLYQKNFEMSRISWGLYPTFEQENLCVH